MIRALLHAVLMASILSVAVSYKDGELEESNSTHLDGSDYWIHDTSYMYRPRWHRLPEGKIVLLNDSTCSNCPEYRAAVENNSSWISKWMLSTEGHRTLHKDVPRLLLYNLVSPMDYGRSLRSDNVRRRRNKAVRMFLADNLALPLVKSLGRVAWNLIQTHYIDTLKDELFVQRLAMMNASEMIQELNISLSEEMIEAIGSEDRYRQNTTKEYNYNGASTRASLYARYSTAFAPYEGYLDRYYTRDDTFSPPTFPADSYPWLWSPQLDLARMIATQLVQSFDIDNDGADVVNATLSAGEQVDSCSLNGAGSGTRCQNLSRQADVFSSENKLHASTSASESTAKEGASSTLHTDDNNVSADDICALDRIHMQLQEYHFDTGIPRLAIRPNVSHSVFPSFANFLRASIGSNAAANVSTQSRCSSSYDLSKAKMAQPRCSEIHVHDDGTGLGNVTDILSRCEVYAALTHYYTYPSTDGDGDDNTGECTMEQLCRMHSGVTVYTPSLTTARLLPIFANTSVPSTAKRDIRLKLLLETVSVAFEAEKRALQHGLRGPSTVWYSSHDLDVDEFADAVLGAFNLSISTDTGDNESASLHVFEHHMNEQVPILDEEISYYADTNYDTKTFMKLDRTTSKPENLDEEELVVIVASLAKQMKELDQSIAIYVKARAANPLYQEVVHATIRQDFYNGSEYTMIGFGFILPATNDQNVLYYDMKLPVPFHLVIRLIVRFQETRLLLPRESRQLLVCLAMANFDLSFYRCRAATTSSTD
ncbi:unnamed protein product [Hyaloperonospora brassicae]|uniref:RxLR effector candidate protein n=1 Tax=Hyaloperonospora brassicae TaxID=162125 RepID=A0AAV0T1N3_HYABA|nr:unnamed protein product [Hyaloperonospora brassicae]